MAAITTDFHHRFINDDLVAHTPPGAHPTSIHNVESTYAGSPFGKSLRMVDGVKQGNVYWDGVFAAVSTDIGRISLWYMVSAPKPLDFNFSWYPHTGTNYSRIGVNVYQNLATPPILPSGYIAIQMWDKLGALKISSVFYHSWGYKSVWHEVVVTFDWENIGGLVEAFLDRDDYGDLMSVGSISGGDGAYNRLSNSSDIYVDLDLNAAGLYGPWNNGYIDHLSFGDVPPMGGISFGSQMNRFGAFGSR